MKNLSMWLGAGLIVAAFSFGACSDDDDLDNPLVTEEDKSFLQQASYGNWAEVDMGMLADSLSMDAGVKMYGQHMQDDHSTAQTELDSIADSWDIGVPAAPDSAHFALRLMMASMASEMFDTAYINGQIKDHEKTIALFEAAAANADRQELRDYANKYLPAIKMHKAMADTMIVRLLAR
jgi:putative membrane protein